MFIRSPDVSHTMVKFIIFTGIVDSVFTKEIIPLATSPSVENSMVLPRSLIVMREHDCNCALAKDIKFNVNNKMKGYVSLRNIGDIGSY